MKIPLQQLLPADISNEAAFHLVKFIHGLSLALESIYFDQMLLYSSECDDDPVPKTMLDDSVVPF